MLRKEHLSDLRTTLHGVCSDFNAMLMEMDGERGHVPLLVNYRPTTAVSRLVNSLKGVSPRFMKKHHSDILRSYSKNALWSPSYFAASCGGAPIGIEQ